MNNKIFLKSVILVLLIFISFIYGFLVSDKKVFPYHLLKSNISENSIYTSYEVSKLDREWAEKLNKGGYIIHLRHAQREKWNDVTAFDAWELANKIKAEDSSFGRAVCLTDQGDEEARLIGNIFNMAGIEISEIISSPSCRARETAIIAFGKIDRISNSLLHRTAMTHGQHISMTKKLREVMEEITLVQGKNVILSGHGGTLSNNTNILIDENKIGELDDRDETGFIILKKENGKIIAEYKYKSIWHFANSFIELEVN